MTGGLAKRYARALAGIAREQRRLEEVAEELENVAAWLADPELAAALSSPAISHEARHALVSQVTESLGLSELTRNFLALLTQNDRLDHFPAISRAFAALVDRELNRLRAVLRSAAPLPDSVASEISRTLEEIHGKKVILSLEVDPSLVAGVAVEIEGTTYDGSARTQLAHIARAMARQGSAN